MQQTFPIPGARVWIRQRPWRVEQVHVDDESNAPRVAYVDATASARHLTPPERLTFLSPFDLVAPVAPRSRLRRVSPRRALMRVAGLLARRAMGPGVDAALEARADVLPHQLEPALAAAQGCRRLLIADEVGLGKTIQAARILSELHGRRPFSRALVIVPTSLRAQWVDELDRRFGLGVHVADRAGLESLERKGVRGENPWRRPGIWLASMDYLKQPHVRAGIPDEPWDLIVIDEAHDVCGDSDRHAAAHDMACRSRQVVLLTGTPHSGDDARFKRLLGLGRLETLERDELTIFRRRRRDLVWPIRRHDRWARIKPSTAERALLDALEVFDGSLRARATRAGRDATPLLASVFKKRAQSSTYALQQSLARRMGWLDHLRAGLAADAWQPSLGFDEDDSELADEEGRALRSASILPEGQERAWLGRLALLAAAAARDERKLRWLERAIRRAGEPVVVFSEYRDSLLHASAVIGRRHRVAVLHGGQTGPERANALAAFLESRADVLISTDVGGQGLNLQTRARWVVHLDLPWRPYRLEQRAGRCDRIGQTRTVHTTRLSSTHATAVALESRLAQQDAAISQAIGDDAHDTQLTPCERWVRPGRVLAKSIVGRRRWLARVPVQARDDGGQRPWRSEWRGWRGTDPLLIFSVPILGADGHTAEHVAVGLVMQEDHASASRSRLSSDLLDRAIAHARAVAAPRARRLMRVMTRRARGEALVERAVTRYILDRLPKDSGQLGLFQARNEAWADAARDSTAAVSVEDANIAPLACRVGPPQLILLLRPRTGDGRGAR